MGVLGRLARHDARRFSPFSVMWRLGVMFTRYVLLEAVPEDGFATSFTMGETIASGRFRTAPVDRYITEDSFVQLLQFNNCL